jgi:glycosyltransferase involved in cell wall biosynthesis
MCKVWIENGVQVTVITSPYDKSDILVRKLITKTEIEGIKLIIINAGDSNRFGIFKRAHRAFLFAVISSYYAANIKSDFVISSSGPITIGIPGLISTWWSKKKLIFEVRDLWPDGAIELGLIKSRVLKMVFRKFESICYKKSAFVVPCSLGMEKNIKTRFPDVDTLVIPNASDNNLFNQDNDDFIFPNWLKSTDRVLIYTGSLGLMDACDEIIHGFNFIENKNDLKLVFIGDGAERKVLEKITETYQLQESIFFTGLIPKKEVVEWYKRALVSFVVFKDFPILGTSSPNKMFDSLAAGVPIIQNTKGWISELVEQFQIGVNVEANDPVSMSNAIKSMLNDQSLVDTMKLNARYLANNQFDRTKLAIEFYNKLNETLFKA